MKRARGAAIIEVLVVVASALGPGLGLLAMTLLATTDPATREVGQKVLGHL